MIAPTLKALVEQAQYICERASLPRDSDINHLRTLGMAWHKAGRPLGDEWRTMEDAPLDGTKVDLLYPYPRGRTLNCFWQADGGWGWRTPTWSLMAAGVGPIIKPETEWDWCTFPNMKPTHWRPVPREPT